MLTYADVCSTRESLAKPTHFSASALLVKLTRESLRQSGGIWRPREWNLARKGAHFTSKASKVRKGAHFTCFTSAKIRDILVQKYLLTRMWNLAPKKKKAGAP